MSEPDDETPSKLPPAVRDVLERVLGALDGGDGEQDNAKLTKVAIIVAVSASVMLALALVLGDREPSVKANAIDDPKALRPVQVKVDPKDDRDMASSGQGGMGGGGGFGGYLLLRNHPEKKPCVDPQLEDAVRRTSGLNMVNGKVAQQAPCVPVR